MIAAAGHPTPLADPGGTRTLHKALAGARVIITQAIYDVDAFARWMENLHRLGVIEMVHVMAEIIPITSSRQLGMINNVPGITVPDELIRELAAAEDRITAGARHGNHDETWTADRRAMEGNRLTRALLHRLRAVHGVSGFYLGCLKSFKAHLELLRETPLLPEHGHTLTKLTKPTGAGRQRALATLPDIESTLDRIRREVKSKQENPVRQALRSAARVPATETLLKILELPKLTLFDCRQCDRCDLSVDALVCPRGCAKQMTHGPCGAPRRVGDRVLCEDGSRECTWAEINRRRNELAIPLHVRLSSRPAPSPGFFEGQQYSALIPVLTGEKDAPDWTLAYRVPAAWLKQRLGGGNAGAEKPDDVPDVPDLVTLIASRRHQIIAWLQEDPAMPDEELLIKSLAAVGTPDALYLIEARIAELGIPAEGTIAELSIREQFQLAGALPRIRETILERRNGASLSPLARTDVLLRILPENARLRNAMRHELANTLIRHIATLGVHVHYTDALLLPPSVESFLHALPIIKEELQLAGVSQGKGENGARLRVSFDRVPYRHHFRKPVALRRIEAGENDSPRGELAVNIKAFDTIDRFRKRVRDELDNWEACIDGKESGTSTDKRDKDLVPLEPFRPESKSLTWQLNAAFWNRLHDFEEATGIRYDESIGGSTDHNIAYVRSTARACFDRVHRYKAASQPMCILEIGVASVGRAITFLEEFKRICEVTHGHGSQEETPQDYLQHTTYVLADFSQELLDAGAEALRKHHPHVETVCIDAGDPAAALSTYKGRIIHAHLCNVYDNLPTDKAALLEGELFRMESRLCASRDSLARIVREQRLPDTCAEELERRLRALGEGKLDAESWLDELTSAVTNCGKPALDYVPLWMSLFESLTFEERYVPVPTATLKNAETSESDLVSDDQLLATARNVLNEYKITSDMTFHINGDALRGFQRLLPLLHPAGVLEVVDIFARRLDEYLSRFLGPAKYDGSTVNWLNGPLFRAVAEASGYTVRFDSFKPFDPRSASVILLAGRSPDNMPDQ